MEYFHTGDDTVRGVKAPMNMQGFGISCMYQSYHSSLH